MLQESIINSHEQPSGLQEINGRCWLVILQQNFSLEKKSAAKHLDENQGINDLLLFPAAALLECGEPVTLHYY